MIDICDPSIASWSDGGDSFIIKDVKEFSKVRVLLRHRLFTFMITGNVVADI